MGTLVRFVAPLAVVALLVPAAVYAANLVPNPGFETLCNGNTIPCNWSSGPGQATVPVTTSTVAHSGARSMRITTTAGFSGQGANSDCVASPPAATYTLSFWYNTADPAASGQDVGYGIYRFPAAGCLTAPSDTSFNTAPMVADGQWHQVTRQVTLTAGPAGAYYVLGQYCVCAVQYDDVSFDSAAAASPTPVIPEMPPWWLFGTGLLALGLQARTRRR